MPSSELEQRTERPPRRLGRVVVGWVGAAVTTVAGGVALALWGLGLTGRLSSSTTDVLDIVKLAFAFVAGVGGTLGLVLAYRRHLLAEDAAVLERGKESRENAKEVREETKLFNERFEKAANQLGSDLYAVKLAGVYAMAGLADDWTDGRQTCIDVLCANLRRRYPVRPDPEHAPAEYQVWRDNQEFRQTVIQAIVNRLRWPESPWHGLDFDFRGAVFDGGVFSGATFSGGMVYFSGATFIGGGLLAFSHATFSGGIVDFADAKFRSGRAKFSHATFSGSMVLFSNATFSGSEVNFNSATFSGGIVDFSGATFSGGKVDFGAAKFDGSEVRFHDATFSGGKVDFGDPYSWTVPPSFGFAADAPPGGVVLPPVSPGSSAPAAS